MLADKKPRPIDLGQLLDARRQVCSVADERTLHAVAAADDTKDHETCVYTDSHLQQGFAPIRRTSIELVQRTPHSNSGPHGCVRGNVEECLDAISVERIDKPAELRHLGLHTYEVTVEQLD